MKLAGDKLTAATEEEMKTEVKTEVKTKVKSEEKTEQGNQPASKPKPPSYSSLPEEMRNLLMGMVERAVGKPCH